jgi:hypothetical protein
MLYEVKNKYFLKTADAEGIIIAENSSSWPLTPAVSCLSLLILRIQRPPSEAGGWDLQPPDQLRDTG